MYVVLYWMRLPYDVFFKSPYMFIFAYLYIPDGKKILQNKFSK